MVHKKIIQMTKQKAIIITKINVNNAIRENVLTAQFIINNIVLQLSVSK